jgi:hypothetical protein
MADEPQTLVSAGPTPAPASPGGWTPPLDKPKAPDWTPAASPAPKETTPEPANSPWKGLARFVAQNPLTAAKLAQEVAFTPASKLPRTDVTKIPDMKGLGPLNPRLLAHVWNDGLAPALDSMHTPAGLEMGIMLGGLKGAAAASIPAKILYKSILGMFGAQSAWALGSKDVPEIAHVIKDPNATTDDVGRVAAHTAADGLFAVLNGFALLHKAGPTGAAAVEGMAQKPSGPQETADSMRAQAEVASTPDEKVAFNVAADRIEDHTAGQQTKGEVSATEPPEKPAPVVQGDPAEIPSYMDEPAKDKIARMMAKLSDMMYVVGKAPKKEYTPDMVRAQDAQGRADAAEIRTELMKVVAQMPIGERGRFTSAITDAMNRPAVGYSSEGLYRRAMHVMVKMMDHIDEVERKDLIADINKAMKKALDSPSVDILYKKRIEQAVGRVAFRSLSDEKRVSLAATRDYIARTGDSAVPQDVVAQIDMLTQTPATELPKSVLEALRDRVQMLAKLGRTVQKSREALYASEQAALTDELKAGKSIPVEDSPIKVTPGIKLTKAAEMAQDAHNAVIKSLNYAGKVGRSLLARDVVMDMMDGNENYRGPVNRVFGGRIDLDYNAEMNLRRAFMEPLEQVLKKNDYSKTESERISIFAISQEEGGEQRLLDSGVTPDTIARVRATITPKELEFYNAARKLFDGTIYPALKKFMRDTYNVDVKQEENYWPFQRDPNLVEPNLASAVTKTEAGETVGFDEMATWKQLQQDFRPRMSTKTEQGMTMERVPEARGAVRLNAIEVADRHLRQVAHLIATQRDVKMLGEIARKDWFREKYGLLGQDYILKLLDTVSRDASPAGSTRTAWLDWFTRNTSTGVIGLRVLSQLKHLPNMAFSLKNVRPDYLVKGLTESMTPEGRAFLQKNFAEIAQRSGGEPAIAEIANGTIWGKIQSGSFAIEKLLDSMDARSTVLGRYFQELEAQGIDHKGYATEPVNKEAQRMALVISRQTVTSPLRKDTPQAISRGTLTGGNMSFTRAMFQFQNTVLKQSGYLKHDIYDLGLKKLDVNQFTFASLAFLAMILGETSIGEANKKLLGLRRQGKDQDSFAKEAFAELLRRIPFAGNFAAAGMYGETGVPAVDTVTQAAKAAHELATGKNDFGGHLTNKERKKEQVKVAGAVGEALGIPGAGTATQLLNRDINHSNR